MTGQAISSHHMAFTQQPTLYHILHVDLLLITVVATQIIDYFLLRFHVASHIVSIHFAKVLLKLLKVYIALPLRVSNEIIISILSATPASTSLVLHIMCQKWIDRLSLSRRLALV